MRVVALTHASERLAERADEVARLISAENGKPVRWARAEVSRAVSTFRWAAEEARRFSGELQRLDTDPAAEGRLALVRRFPRGPVLGICPFNFPLNLVAHKVAPAIAMGAPIVVKPAPATPLSALLLGGCSPRPTCQPRCSPSCRCQTTAPLRSSRTPGCRWSPSPDQGRERPLGSVSTIPPPVPTAGRMIWSTYSVTRTAGSSTGGSGATNAARLQAR